MLSEVRLYDSRGKCKKVLSGKKLSKEYWKKLDCSQTSCTPMKFGKGKRSNKSKLLEEFDYFPDDPFDMHDIENQI